MNWFEEKTSLEKLGTSTVVVENNQTKNLNLDNFIWNLNEKYNTNVEILDNIYFWNKELEDLHMLYNALGDFFWELSPIYKKRNTNYNKKINF